MLLTSTFCDHGSNPDARPIPCYLSSLIPIDQLSRLEAKAKHSSRWIEGFTKWQKERQI